MGRRALSLISLLASLAIIVILVAVMYGTLGRRVPEPLPTRPGGPTTPLAQSLERGAEVACRNNLRQIRSALQMEAAAGEDGGPPASLTSFAPRYGLTGEMLACPVTRQPYVYEAAAGKVRCPTPGHDAF